MRRGAEDLTRRQPEHASDVHERPQRAVLQSKDGRVIAGFVDDRILEEGQRRHTRQAVVGQNVQEIAVDGASHRGLNVVPERVTAVNRAQVEQGARQVQLRPHRVAQPLLVARSPFSLARHQERLVVGHVDSRQIVTFGQRGRHMLEPLLQHRPLAVVFDDHDQLRRMPGE